VDRDTGSGGLDRGIAGAGARCGGFFLVDVRLPVTRAAVGVWYQFGNGEAQIACAETGEGQAIFITNA